MKSPERGPRRKEFLWGSSPKVNFLCNARRFKPCFSVCVSYVHTHERCFAFRKALPAVHVEDGATTAIALFVSFGVTRETDIFRCQSVVCLA